MHIEELSLIAAGGLVVVVAVAMLAGRVRIAAPLILVVVGIGIGYIPGVPLISVDPEIILIGVLPPILYAAAVNVPILDLRRNLGPISALSVSLVIISAVILGFLLHWIIPSIPLAAAIALGAVVAPTDAVAATSIGKRVGMPPRLVTILEGESLVNDATSLVLLRTAIAAIAGGFSFVHASGQFAYAVVIAIAIGSLIGVITVWVRSHIKNPVYDTVVSFAVPFISFVPTEYLGASGVLAVVITGLYSGHFAPRKFSATARMNERLNWRTAQFLLENGVFLLMGLELHKIINDVGQGAVPLLEILVVAVGVVIVLIVLRMAFMFFVTWQLSRALPRHEARADGMRRLADRVMVAPPASNARLEHRRLRFERAARRSEADAAHARDEGLDWHGTVILGWSGMRGVVTLAAAQSIPESVPYRSQIVLIAFFAAVITLLLHGLSLPGLIRKLRPTGPTASDHNEELIALYNDLMQSGEEALISAIEHTRNDETALTVNENVVRRARSSMHNSLAPMAFSMPKLDESERSAAESDARAYIRLAHAIIEAQRATLLEERAIGQYSSSVLRTAEEVLDAHEIRLTPPQKH